MKKLFKRLSVLVVSLSLIFCNFITVYAADGYRIYTNESVSDFYGSNTLFNNLLNKIYVYDGSDISELYSTLNSFSLSDFENYIIWYAADSDTLYYYSWDDTNIGVLYCPNNYNTNNNTLNSNGYFITNNTSTDHFKRFYCPNASSSGTWSIESGAGIWYADTINGVTYKYEEDSLKVISFGGNAQLFMNDDTSSFGYGTRYNVCVALNNGDYSQFTNFFDPNLPYTNDEGSIVDPVPDVEIESNENHMYLKSCDVGFCKPYSTSDLSSAGGGYLYVNYTYDNWINSHSSDYWVNIRTVVNVDGTQYSGINTRALDLNGVNVLTFKESTVPNNWTNEGLLFVEFPNTVVSSYKAGYVYSIPYLTFANTDSGGISNRSRFLGNGRNRLFLTPSGGRGYDITNESLGDFLQSIFNVNVHQKFTLTVTVWLQDTNNNRSGEFTKSFNLITGVGTTTDTGITDNDNPFEPDPMLPDIPDGSGNDSNSVAPIVNNFMINGSGTIGYDPGYRELKEDLDKDPDGNFSQYLDPMHNDDVGSWFMSFVDEMPTEMKSILIAGVGVGVLFGLYRFIRRG